MLADFTNTSDYMPQAYPFLMIDRCVMPSLELFLGYYTIVEDNPLISSGVPSSNILIEFVAQTCAAGFGWITKDKVVEPRFIGAISKLNVYKDIQVGDSVNSRVYIKTKFEKIQLIKGEVYHRNELIMDCRMKIVEQ